MEKLDDGEMDHEESDHGATDHETESELSNTPESPPTKRMEHSRYSLRAKVNPPTSLHMKSLGLSIN